jgi:hypothetical protein
MLPLPEMEELKEEIWLHNFVAFNGVAFFSYFFS